jgi:hypothetical protein
MTIEIAFVVFILCVVWCVPVSVSAWWMVDGGYLHRTISPMLVGVRLPVPIVGC